MHVGRFVYAEGGARKDSRKLDFGLELDVAPFMAATQQQQQPTQ